MNSKTQTLLTLIFAMALASSAAGREPAPETCFYTVEFTHPKATPGLWLVDVIFLVDVTPATALEYLRIQLATAVRFMAPKEAQEGFMATAWRSAGPTEADEKQIELPDGSHYLIYKKGRYLSAKEAGAKFP